MNRLLLASIALGVSAGVASAASLNLSYVKTSLGSLWQYDMTLSVDTSVTGWSSGMGWRWLIFGDVPSGASPLADFVITSGFPVGPWTGLGSTSGGHNGPSFDFVLDYWIPSASTDTLHWVGTSATNAAADTLKFSTIAGTVGGATANDFKTMIEVVPEPSSLLVLGGLAPLFLLKRRSRK
jgi:hypothetical protein